MIVRLEKGKGGNPIGDMDDILQQAKKKLNGTVVEGLVVSQRDHGDHVIIKIEAV